MRFGSFSGVLAASEVRLNEVEVIGNKASLLLKLLHAAASRFARDGIRKRPLLASWHAVIDYCRAAMAYEDREQFRILFLDKKNALVADEVQQIGTVDHAPVYPREIVKRAPELSATAVILVHNHPSGDPEPSRADIEMTARVVGRHEAGHRRTRSYCRWPERARELQGPWPHLTRGD